MAWTIVLVFGVTASLVAAIAEAQMARSSGGRQHFWIAGGSALLALVCAFYLVKG